MAFLDFTLIIDYILALAVVALPVEAGILLLVNSIRRTITSPERRGELLAEAAEQFWEPFKEPVQRAELIHEFASAVWQPMSTPEARQKLLAELWAPFSDPENRQKLIAEGAHGIMRAISERAGSLRGVAARADKGAIIDAITEGGAPELLSKIPGKVKLPVIGNVSIGEAISIAGALKSMFQGGNILQGASAASSGSTGGGYPP